MSHSEILLLKPVENLGSEGDQVKVRAGYARNYLLPRKYAAPLTTANRRQVESLKKRRAEREAQEIQCARELAGKLEKTRIVFAVKTGEGGKMFGAITATDLHAKIAEAGIDLDKRKIHLHTPVKTLGKHEVKIRLHPEVAVELTFEVVSENPIETAEAPEPEVKKTEKKATRRRVTSEKVEKKEKPAG
ncbi:MAG: 50S ribosomal protein L9 [Opitutaceae bacterium]|jgi:large subunit ribosomal protein L9|nr:50S ribosomal protein L9 [Opitutaceae bacterium]